MFAEEGQGAVTTGIFHDEVLEEEEEVVGGKEGWASRRGRPWLDGPW
jgi:hypothetical protein